MYGKGLRAELLALLEKFFNEEQGNKITPFNMGGLIGSVNGLLDKHTIKEKKEKEK
ncbi:MAG: hypothetical protein JRJ29_00250 [Deltaproteobacteria bacterium]|nr:hypothetical protein [Deltaproteobacteria bacterium]MBW2081594.1 hypothetical protein [Deltaproteobacteria bacterium]